MYKYIQFDIHAIENLKLGKFERDANNWYSHSYIPGSVIKGAIVWNLVQKRGEVEKKILNGDTIFYNAYPLVEGENTIPMIQGYVGDKQEVRSNRADICLYHSFSTEKHENVIPYNNYEFIIFDKDRSRIAGYNTQLVEKLHINKKDAKGGNKTLMFRYEAVKKGESFRGYIRVDEKFCEDIYSILDEGILYFGGSRGSGYGKCEISNIRYVDSVNLFNSDTDIEDDLYVYFLSDAILYYDGKAYTYLPEKVLKERLDIKGDCRFVDSFINLDKAATYNNMYHTNTVCYTCVTKGSILRYRVNEKIDSEKIREFVSKGVGLRKEDGYGQIAVLGKIADRLVISGYEKEAKIDLTDNVILSGEDKRLIYSILRKIFYNRTLLKTEKLVINLLNKQNKPDEGVQSQIGKIYNLFQNSVYKSEDDFKSELREYLNHMESKRGKEAWHKLSRITFLYKESGSEEKETGQNDRGHIFKVQTLLKDFADGKSNAIFDELKIMAAEGIRLEEYVYPDETELNDVIYRLQQTFFLKLFGQFLRIKG
ncbi:MAG TPA: CRISPR-associated protein [Mobilitalea sp.]|nr:CRISPR-associated protein [Mobilitalea sp.]